MTYSDYISYIELCASEWDGEQDVYEFASECADSSEYAIYYSKAWDLVEMMRHADSGILTNADALLTENAPYEFCGIDDLMTRLAYVMIYEGVTETIEAKLEAA
jgi:hypothetical protein